MIDKDKWYSLKEINDSHLIPMFKSKYSIKKWIESGKLQAVKAGSEKGSRYKIKGSWIIMFLAKYEAGDFH